ncbi:DASH family cryptochrome [Mucilaginibacter pallidiroseus]|uniref:DASH family cryptochrome n=1 Tax=Mucilaginibacter pallidiroseus TaxID=2599295 RepID=A0A563TZ19_9SPHI|nr:deoxyribodipyrimidine photo-lyase [Mucilaginibacter pallidiroseus]TWR24380.1 DASH family cryptochrome [Mucilaginibacter pallidiroseus]
MNDNTIMVWFRNDLRIYDNEVISGALRKAERILPVYIFDPYYFGKNEYGFFRTGSFRGRFLLESVAALRAKFRAAGSDLIVRTGDPADLIPRLAEQYQVSSVYHHAEMTPYENAVSGKTEQLLWKMQITLRYFSPDTLYRKEDLPFRISDIPDDFGVFKKKLIRDSQIRPLMTEVHDLRTPVILNPGEIPILSKLGVPASCIDPAVGGRYTGGEEAAFARLHALQTALTNGYTNICPDDLTPWLTFGCISPARIFWSITRSVSGKHTGFTGKVVCGLIRRDHYKFLFKRKQLEAKADLNEETAKMSGRQKKVFEQWKNGETGESSVDAAMKELNATGHLNNVSREITALYLIRNLNKHWKKGAALYEERLIDYSLSIDSGHWHRLAGVEKKEKKARLTFSESPEILYDRPHQ